eukprot:1162128-Pelagomonas_calceolata.AAC.1
MCSRYGLTSLCLGWCNGVHTPGRGVACSLTEMTMSKAAYTRVVARTGPCQKLHIPVLLHAQ